MLISIISLKLICSHRQILGQRTTLFSMKGGRGVSEIAAGVEREGGGSQELLWLQIYLKRVHLLI